MPYSDWTTIPGLLALLDSPPATDQDIAQKYDSRCVRCLNLANSIHELIPRSLCHVLGRDPMAERNRVSLCAACHDWAQTEPTSKAMELRAAADKFLSTLHG